MSDNQHVLDYLREQFARVQLRFDRIESDLSDVKRRLTSLESQVALLHGDFAGQSARIDRIEQRLERIERRLDLTEAAS